MVSVPDTPVPGSTMILYVILGRHVFLIDIMVSKIHPMWVILHHLNDTRWPVLNFVVIFISIILK